MLSGHWQRKQGSKEELSLDYLPNDGSCVIYGKANVYEASDEVASIHFSEYWVKQAADWRIQSLHMSRVK